MDDILDKIPGLIEFIVTLPLCFLIVLAVHEMGHYWAARVTGLRVESVAFGAGRVIWSRVDKRGTLWAVHLWPVRAHVHIADFENVEISLKRRLFVILAGPATNFVLPFLLFFIFYAGFGKPAMLPVLTMVDIGFPAYEAGLLPGDRILSVNDENVWSLEQIQNHVFPVSATQGPPFKVRYERGGVEHDTFVMPVLMNYRDKDGVVRSHGRIGLTTYQGAYKLEYIKSVEGKAVDNEEEARAALLEHMDHRITVGVEYMDGKIYPSLMDLSARANPNLGDDGHDDADMLFLGGLRDNVYMPLSVMGVLRETGVDASRMIGNVLRLPFNLFPVDPTWIKPKIVVSKETSYPLEVFYKFIFRTALLSCLIGIINLAPFPRLDGGTAILFIARKWKRRDLLRKEQAAVLVFSLLFIYAAILGLNMVDMQGYYEFKLNGDAAEESGN